MKENVECAGCYGTGTDEAGETVMRCPVCHGRGSVSWSRVVWLGMQDRYPAKVQLEQGTLKVREAIDVVSP